MTQIEILPEALANQIAAGEVIERPVSAVKELVENAIDAGADRITITLESGGKQLIQVTDNGSGISKDDLPKTIISHATSKIKTKEDLFRISTLGFRGEALSSIASVSSMTIISNDGVTSYQLQMNGSKIDALTEHGHPQGTTIIIKNLFENFPARMKFLKKENTEYSRILDYVKKLALAAHEISIVLINNDKETFRSQGVKNNRLIALKNSMAKVYGRNVLDNLLEMSLVADNYSAWGLISSPQNTRTDRKGINIFVNNRLVYSAIINKAIDVALRDILLGPQYPYLCCFLNIPYEEIDVNVHPQKKEVRFSDNNKVFSLVSSLIRNAFTAKEIQDKNAAAQTKETFNTRVQNFSPDTPATKSYVSATNSNAFEENLLSPELINQRGFENTSSTIAARGLIKQLETPDDHPNIVVLGQANRSWIIALDGEDLIVIDQHAAHERINYEILKTNQHKNHLAQGLLIPIQVSLSPEQQDTLSDTSDYLHQLGFDFDSYSGNQMMLRGVPQNLKTDIDYQQVFTELLDEIEETGKSSNSEDMGEQILKMTACKASIKAGETLTYMEMKQLVNDLFSTDNYMSCPHGRPTITTLTDNELRKRFKRT